MKLRLSSQQRDKGQRIMKRATKMMKVALFILAANLLADKTVFNIMKDNLMGISDESYDMQENIETAFLDSYGDFEMMIQARKIAEEAEGNYIPFTARASTVYNAPKAVMDA